MKEKNIIKFLGTGAADSMELHAGDCEGENCVKARALGGRNLRRASSLFISPGTVVDFSSEEHLRRHCVEGDSIRQLLITHSHYDHFEPVQILDFARRLSHPLAVYGNRNVENALDFAATHRWNASTERFELNRNSSELAVRAIGPGESFSLGELKVSPVLANHMIDKEHLIPEEQALNYVLERGEKVLFYGLDSSYLLPETLEIVSRFQFDIVVLDATFGHLKIPSFGSGHQNFAMLEDTANQFREANLLKNKAVVVADHISHHEVAPHDEVVGELAEKGIVLAYDGMVLEY